jgi:hypothetical protein
LHVFLSPSLLEEIQDDFDEVDDVAGDFNFEERLILLHAWVVDAIALVGFNDAVIGCFAPLVNGREHQNKGSYKEGVDGEDGDHEVPDLAEGAFLVDPVPLALLRLLCLSRFFLRFFVDVVDHHFLQIRLRHLLQTRLEPKLVVESPSLVPKLSNVCLFLCFVHLLEP